MAESFNNSFVRAAGIVTSSPLGSIGITTNLITGISTTGVAVGDLVYNTNFIGGTRVSSVGTGEVVADRDSTNTSSTSNQNIKFLGVTTAYTSSTGVKSILIGGTLTNNDNNQISITVQIFDNSANSTYNLLYDVPIPAGSSLILSDAGKTLLEGDDEVRVFCDTANALDVSLSILTGVS
jgi:hypothetical protein